MLYGKILYELPEPSISPLLVESFFSDEMFEGVKKQIEKTSMGKENGTYHPMMGRWASGMTMAPEVEEYVLDRVRKMFNDESLVRAYHYAVIYQIKDGCIPNLWEHYDQNGSQISVNITIENTANWSLIVEGKEYKQSPNEAVVFCGQQHAHARPPYPTRDEAARTTQLFMHYSSPNHWIQDKNFGGVGKYGKDGDIRFFNKHRYLPLPDPPIDQPVGKDQDYSGVLAYYDEIVGHAFDTDTELADIKVISKKELAPGIVLYETGNSASRTLKGLVQNAMFRQWEAAKVFVGENKLGVDQSSRKCYNYFLDHRQDDCHPQDPIVRAKKSLETGLDLIVEDFKKRYSLRNLVSDTTVLLRYEHGGMYHNHYDASASHPRVVSVSMILNDDFDGGELAFKEFGLEISPRAGDVIVFSSSFPYMHEVQPVTRGVRYTAVKWYNYAGDTANGT
jgi:hypothetical protein